MKSIAIGEELRVCPCRNCKDRKLGCHTDCSKYKEWRIEREHFKDSIKYDYRASYGWSYTRSKK